jgi:hypothetical protein
MLMRHRRSSPNVSSLAFLSFVSCVFVVSSASSADAQSADAVSIRAQGMGGAFTAVADDATATWWNPAGLAAGPYLNATLEYGRLPDADADHRAIALAFPALGFSYYRLRVSEIRPTDSTAASAAGRQDPGTLVVRSLDVSQFGATVGQSVGGHLVIGSTVKLLRAAGETQGGLDIGAMAAVGLVRVGVMVRNVREATFGEGADAFTLRRQVRGGLAVTTVPRSVFGGGTIAVDADFRPVATALGDERRVGVGGEIWTRQRSLGARAGFSASTIGDGRTAPTAGLSVALRRGIYVDGQVTGGSDSTRRGWGAALRMSY